MFKFSKLSAMLTTALLLSFIALSLTSTIYAQTSDAQVVVGVFPQGGGTTNPAPGTYNYANGTIVTLTATPSAGYEFLYWTIEGGYTTAPNQPPSLFPNGIIDPNTGEIIGTPPPLPSSSVGTFESLQAAQNPLVIMCGYGYTFSYKAIFAASAPTSRPFAVVVVKEGPGGNTNPSPGTYTFAQGATIKLTATPDPGYEFKYWTVSGTGSGGHPTIITTNPLSPTCGIGYTFDYQPVFAPTGTGTTSTGGVPLEYYAIIVILAIIAIIGIGLALMYRRRSK